MKLRKPLKKAKEWEEMIIKRPYRTNRILQFATKVSPEFDQRIREIAFTEGIYIAELLEKCLEAYIYVKKNKINIESLSENNKLLKNETIISKRERERERDQNPASRTKNKKISP